MPRTILDAAMLRAKKSRKGMRSGHRIPIGTAIAKAVIECPEGKEN